MKKNVAWPRLFGVKNAKTEKRAVQNGRKRLVFESLEARALLSVSPSNLAEPDPFAAQAVYDVAELDDERLSTAALQASLDVGTPAVYGLESNGVVCDFSESTVWLGGSLYAYVAGLPTSSGAVSSKAVGEYEIGGYCDADKRLPYAGGEDSNMCWAGSAANMLAYSGWVVDDARTADQIFDVYRDNFSNDGGNVGTAISWFFVGSGGTGGFLSQSEYNANYSRSSGYLKVSVAEMATMAEHLRAGDAVGLSVGGYGGSQRVSGHAINVYGYVYDDSYSPSDPNYYQELIIADNNDMSDQLVRYKITWSSQYSTYLMPHEDVERGGYEGRVETFYYLKKNSATNADDVFEENDSRAAAYDLGAIPTSTLPNLKIVGTEEDWFQFELENDGTSDADVSLAATANLALSLYDANGALIQNAATSNGVASISFADLSAGNYFVKIDGGTEGQTVDYALSIDQPIAACAAPRVSVDSVTANSATISWTPVEGAGSYYLYYRAPGSSSYSSVATLSNTTTSYTLTGLAPETQYEYRLRVIAYTNYEDSRANFKVNTARADGQEPDPISTVVTTAADVVDLYDGVVSLREAYEYAQDGETITFDAETFADVQTIELDGTELYIAKNIKIDGAVGSKQITIDGAGKSRVLRVGYASTVELSNLTIANGNVDGSGGGIYNDGGSVAATNVAVVDCSASNYGGGICNYGAFTATDLTVSDNASQSGGGIYSRKAYSNRDATFTATNLIVSGNSAKYYGGGICLSNADLEAKNALVFGNSAGYYGGGAYSNSGSQTYVNSTIAGNASKYSGSGLYVYSGAATLKNSIVAFNASKNKRGFEDIYTRDEATVESYNVATGYAASDVAENVVPYDSKPLFVVAPTFDDEYNLTNADALDLRLAPDSVALDAGNDAYAAEIATDLDGNARIQGAAVDLGAYETRYVPPIITLETPTITSTEVGAREIVVRWNAVENAFGYEVRCAVAGTDDYQTITVDASTTVARFENLAPETTHALSVKAVGAENYVDSAYSAPVEATTKALEPLAAPTITSTEVGASGILVRWNRAANASGYEVRYAVAGTDEYQTISVAAGKTSLLLTGLDGSTTHSIRVKALGSGEYADSEYSAAVEATTWKKLATPKITETAVATGVLVKWSKVYGAASYTVTCVPVDASDAKTVFATFDASKSQGLFNILRPETKYSITVRANAPSETQTTASESSAAVEVATNPMAAPTLTGGSPHAGSKGILLKWNSVGGATGYQVETREAGSNGEYNVATVAAASGTTQTVLITDIPRVSKYEIRVKALGLDGVYADSPYTETTLDAKVLTTPKLTKISARANGDLLVNWQKAYGAASYAVEYKLDGESEWTVISGITNKAGNKTLTGLVPGGTYAIRVKAVGSGSYLDSAYSDEGTATTAKGANATAFVALDSVFADFADDEDDEFWAI